jgi:hypothetical protein
MDLIPLNADLVRGSHGAPVEDPVHQPILLTDAIELPDGSHLDSTEVHGLISGFFA